MIGCLRTRVRKQPIIGLYFESETVLKFHNLRVSTKGAPICRHMYQVCIILFLNQPQMDGFDGWMGGMDQWMDG